MAIQIVAIALVVSEPLPAASSSSYTYGDSYEQMYQRSTEQAGK